MASKIELYREVLEIEPNSKVFFPLARLLVEEGHVDEAIEILQRGIGFHPDHLEAKFLLIDILTRLEREKEAEAVFSDVGNVLSRYPAVWLLWSRAAAARSKDPSLAMLFLGNYFQNDSLTWAEVMERGLRSLSQAAAAPTGTASPASGSAPKPKPVISAPEPAPEPPAAPEPPVAPKTSAAPETPPPPEAPSGEPPLRGAREVMALAELLPEPETCSPKVATKSGKGRPPVRTRTMAALLAGQGDTAGALAIYDDLIKAAPAGAERDDLISLAAALRPESSREQAVAAETTPTVATTQEAKPTAAVQPKKSTTKLISLLETLAGRLESRAEA